MRKNIDPRHSEHHSTSSISDTGANLIANPASLRSEPFNESNLEHEMSLLQLWTLLQPDTPLHKRVTKQWQTIGE